MDDSAPAGRGLAGQQRVEGTLARRSRWLVAINALALDLATLPGDADLASFLTTRLRQLTGAVAVAFSEYDPEDRVLATRAIEFQPGAVRTITAPLARRLTGTRSPVSDEAYAEIMAGTNTTRATLTEASFGAIPPAVDITVRKLLGVDRFVGISHVVEGALYGTSILALRAGAPDPPPEELEVFGNLAAVSLRRRRAEIALAQHVEQIDRLFELSADILGITDGDGIIRRVSPAWQTTLGYSTEETEGRPVYDFIHPDDIQKTRTAVASLQAHQPPAELVTRQRHRDGSYRLIDWRVTRFEGQLMIAVGRDITARVEAQEQQDKRQRSSADELRRGSAYNRRLIEASPDPLVTMGPDGLITDVNEATVRATGRTREELVGTDFADYFTRPDRARAVYEQVFREGSVHDLPLELKHRDGSLAEVLYNASTYQDADGRVVGALAAAREVGELRRAEAEIRALNAGLELRVQERTHELATANRELQEFVYSVAHDLRSPLRAVDGFSLAVMEDYGDVITEQGRRDLRRVRAAAQSMGELIDALLSLARIGRRDVEIEDVDLSAIARRVIAERREDEPDRVVSVVVEEGLVAESDVALVDVVLENLLGNAWKFTARQADARIEFGSMAHDDDPVFFVRDNGAGFDQAYVHKLFTPFQRLHTTEQFQGTGIGLATVARVLGRLGGTCRAEGEVGCGATFFFTLGRPPSANETPPAPDDRH